MFTGLYLGGFCSIASLFLAASLEGGERLPIAEGAGMGSVALLLWAVRILKQERDTALCNLEIARDRIHSSEMKCLGCDYFRYHRLLSLVLQTDTHSNSADDDTLPSLETHSIDPESQG